MLRVDDDFYGELAPADALKLANAIQRVFGASTAERFIRYRGSVTDLATDIAGELTTVQARELIAELQRFMGELPDKFKR